MQLKTVNMTTNSQEWPDQELLDMAGMRVALGQRRNPTCGEVLFLGEVLRGEQAAPTSIESRASRLAWPVTDLLGDGLRRWKRNIKGRYVGADNSTLPIPVDILSLGMRGFRGGFLSTKRSALAKWARVASPTDRFQTVSDHHAHIARQLGRFTVIPFDGAGIVGGAVFALEPGGNLMVCDIGRAMRAVTELAPLVHAGIVKFVTLSRQVELSIVQLIESDESSRHINWCPQSISVIKESEPEATLLGDGAPTERTVTLVPRKLARDAADVTLVPESDVGPSDEDLL